MQDMEILRQKLRADKKLVVSENMTSSAEESRDFWPVYEAYQTELAALNQRLGTLIDDYAIAYSKDSVSNETATRLTDELLAIEAAETQLKKDYVPRFGKVLPAVKVARYLQIETKIRAAVRYELANEIPLIE